MCYVFLDLCSVRVSDKLDFQKQIPVIMSSLTTSIVYNQSSIWNLGLYGADQEISVLLSLIFESQLCSLGFLGEYTLQTSSD